MTDKEKKMAHEFFKAYDYDASGTIDFGELTELLQARECCAQVSGVRGHVAKIL